LESAFPEARQLDLIGTMHRASFEDIRWLLQQGCRITDHTLEVLYRKRPFEFVQQFIQHYPQHASFRTYYLSVRGMRSHFLSYKHLCFIEERYLQDTLDMKEAALRAKNVSVSSWTYVVSLGIAGDEGEVECRTYPTREVCLKDLRQFFLRVLDVSIVVSSHTGTT
jgi:hypothetical protein